MDEQIQKNLLHIIKSWKITGKSEYRGFYCGGCQKKLDTEAWHYFLHTDGYISPLHFCDDCHEKLEDNMFETLQSVSHEKINPHYAPSTISTFEKIVNSWNINQKPLKKEFECDKCGVRLNTRNSKAQGYHVWWRRNDKMLVELHFDKECGEKLLK